MSVLEEENQFIADILSDVFQSEEHGQFNLADPDRLFRCIDPDVFLEENQNKNTKKKTESDIKLFNAFLLSKNVSRHPELLDPETLNALLCQFILGVTKKDGREYEPTTIRGMISSIDRYLRGTNNKMEIFKDIEFAKCRAVLKKKQQQLKSLGFGNKPKAAEQLTEDYIATMLECGTLGDSTPRALLHSLSLICTSYFGMRTGKECHDLCWGDVQLCVDETNGTEYLIYDKERQTKTRTGVNPRDTRILKPKAFANPSNPKRDPVHLYKLYKNKRPQEMLEENSPFFLTPAGVGHKCWIKKSPMGTNKLYNIMNEMKTDSGIENPRITPYSSRKRLIQTLQDEGVPANQIVQVSGHKNVNSINNYSRINNQQAKEISSILSNDRPQSSELPLQVVKPGVAQCHSTPSQTAGFSRTSKQSGIPRGFSPNCHFHGPVTLNFNSNISETQTLSQVPTVHVNAVSSGPGQNPVVESPSPVRRPFKRIRSYFHEWRSSFLDKHIFFFITFRKK